MLRVTICDGPGEFRLRLEGRLAGPWVREVELCWKIICAPATSRTVTVDLCDVDFIDSAGEQLLAGMHHRGAKLVATGLMTRELVSKITGEATETAEPPALHRPRTRLR